MERFSRLYSIGKRLYVNNSPVILEAGVLLKDNETKKILVQLKMRSICNEKIIAVIVKIIGYDVLGNLILDGHEYQYLDLKIKRNDQFGDRIPIFLNNDSVRSIEVFIQSVVFENGNVFSITSDVWEAIPEQDTLESYFKSESLVEQYKLEYGRTCKYRPFICRDLWLCTCGNINHNYEKNCLMCNLVYEDTAITNELVDELKKTYAERIACEKAEAEEHSREKERAKQHLREVRQNKIKHFRNVLLGVLCPLVLIIIAVFIYRNYVIPHRTYEDAIKLFENQNYVEAQQSFYALGEYKDSAEWISACIYEESKELLKTGDYENAILQFASLGDYKDSQDYLKQSLQAKYDEAFSLYKAGKIHSIKAMAMLEEILDYGDYVEIDADYELDYYIARFCNYKKDQQAWTYFVNNVRAGKYNYIDGDNIKETIVGKWMITRYDRGRNEDQQEVEFFENGETSIKYHNLYKYWSVEDDSLKWGGEKQLVKIKEGVYLSLKIDNGTVYIGSMFIKQ